MCGIFGLVTSKKHPADEILAGLRDLEYRGYDSWGVTVEQNGRLETHKEVGPIKVESLHWQPTQLGIGHTRWATHGGVTVANAHPHLSADGQFAVVHNGIVENFLLLREELQNQGYSFRSETDSEVIVHLMVANYQQCGDVWQAWQQTWSRLTGLNAVVLLALRARRLFLGRRGSPLAVGRLADGYAVASDGAALASLTNQVLFLADGQLAQLSAEQAWFYQESGEVIMPVWRQISADTIDQDDGRFPHQMLREINQQPTVLHRLSQRAETELQPVVDRLVKAPAIYFLACGTAWHAALLGEQFLAAQGIASRTILASEASSFTRFIAEGTVVVVLSQSGETIDVVEPLIQWQARGAKVIAITNSPWSTLDRMADLKLQLAAGREKAVASTKAFMAKMALLFWLSQMISGHFSAGKCSVEAAAEVLDSLLRDQIWLGKIEQLAKELTNQPNLFLLGRGSFLPIALEAALKIKEISYLHAEAMAAGELKHGTLALIEAGVPCLLFGSAQQQTETITTALELKARGGWLVGIATQSDAVFDRSIILPEEPLAQLAAAALFSQLLAYHLAILRGNNPDRPRNLAKSVTVK